MASSRDEITLSELFRSLTGILPESFTALKPHASDRRIYRLKGAGSSIVGVANDNSSENKAFIYLARHFRGLSFPVPNVLCVSPDAGAYLLDDLGDITLWDALVFTRKRTQEEFPQDITRVYRKALTHLVSFQVVGARTLDFSRCYPEEVFSSSALHQDMVGFSSELVQRLLPSYDISSLNSDYTSLSTLISNAPSNYFLYRDFQSRNIMVQGESLSFIDFQGGRRGPLQYDVVSLLYQSSAKIPSEHRDALLEYYLSELGRVTDCDVSQFRSLYGLFIVARMLQVLGVYGRQGLGAGKEYFRASIPQALHTLREQLNSGNLPSIFPELARCVARLEEAQHKVLSNDKP